MSSQTSNSPRNGADFESADFSRFDFDGSLDLGRDGCTLQFHHTDVIPLDPEMMRTLSRRSRRRLREIQVRCQLSAMRLDRTRGCLHVAGTEAAIRVARVQLDGLSGPRKQVARAVWAELMRTRMETPTSEVNVTSLHEKTGCRVHIERSQCEVRLFGARNEVAAAQRCIDELTTECAEESLSVSKSLTFPTSLLHSIACQCHATLTQEEDKIVVLGLRQAVDQSVAELSAYLSGQKDIPAEHVICDELNQANAARIAAGAPGTTLPNTQISVPPPQMPQMAREALSRQQRQPQQTYGNSGPKRGGGQAPVHMDRMDRMDNTYRGQYQPANNWGQMGCSNPCVTCGAAQFCTECGASIVGLRQAGIQHGCHDTSGKQDMAAQQWMPQQQVVLVPYNGNAQPMSAVCVPGYNMMQTHPAMGAQGFSPGDINMGKQQQTYMIPAMAQQCVILPGNGQSQTFSSLPGYAGLHTPSMDSLGDGSSDMTAEHV